MNILFVACDAGGDLYPATAIAVGLINRGYRVSIYGEQSALKVLSNLNAEKILAPRELDFIPRFISALKTNRDNDSKEMDGAVLKDLLDQYSKDQANEITSSLCGKPNPDLILTPLVGARIGHLLSEQHGIPYCVVNSDYYIGPHPPRDPRLDFDHRCLSEVEYLLPFVQAANLVLIATSKEFDLGYDRLPTNNHYVGPLVWGENKDLPDYFNEPGNPWVLLTLSSQKQSDVPIARLSLKALTKQPVRIIETIGRGHRRKEVGKVPVGIHIERFVPHVQILKHCKLVVSHSGMCSVMNALWFGVPMVLVPWGRDQAGVAMRAKRLGIAQVVKRNELTDERLEQAIVDVLDTPSYHIRAKKMSDQMQRLRPVQTACDLIEAAIF